MVSEFEAYTVILI